MKRKIIIPDFMIVLLYFRNGDKSVSDVKSESKMTYSHLYEMKKIFTIQGWCNEEVEGRRKIVKLTAQGKKILNDIEVLMYDIGIPLSDMMLYRKRIIH
jgi:predicted transcriptional regulator